MISSATPEPLVAVDREGVFTLQIRFATSCHNLPVCEGTHAHCVEQANLVIELIRREHRQNRTGWTFQQSCRPIKSGVVIYVNKIPDVTYGVKKKASSALWMTLEIQEKKPETIVLD